MLEYIEWIVMISAVVGVVLNNYKIIWCFPIWLVSNTLAFVVHYHASMNGMIVRDGIFILLAVHGWHQWKQCPKL